MSFLKNHYEKIILTAFLLIFIIALIFQIRIIAKSLDVKADDLDIPPKNPDYRSVDFSEYNIMKVLSKEKNWVPSEPRVPDDRDFTDFLEPIKAARCPFCEKIIPCSNFTIDHKCSLCGATLEELKDAETDDSVIDTDGDGIPDKVELELGMDITNPDDVHADLDQDGFNNFYEFNVSKTKLNDPKSRPILAKRLVVLGIRRNKLPVVVESVKTNSTDDKSKWLIQAEDKIKKRTRFWSLGQTVKIGRSSFKISDIEFKVKEKYNASLKSVQNVDKSVVTLVKLKPNGLPKEDSAPIKAVVKEPVYEPQEMVYLRDVVSRQVYKRLVAGDTFKMGDERVGIEVYELLSINKRKKAVTIQRITPSKKKIGEPYTVTNKVQIPEVEKVERRSTGRPEDMPMMDPLLEEERRQRAKPPRRRRR